MKNLDIATLGKLTQILASSDATYAKIPDAINRLAEVFPEANMPIVPPTIEVATLQYRYDTGVCVEMPCLINIKNKTIIYVASDIKHVDETCVSKSVKTVDYDIFYINDADDDTTNNRGYTMVSEIA